jgi:hypothetical protein
LKSSWNKSSSALKTKTGKETNMIKSGKDMSGYGQFGGGSFVLISKRKNGEMIVRELAGSLQDLKNQAEDLAKMTGQDVNEVVVGYHDVGSWSAKPSSKNKKIGYTNIAIIKHFRIILINRQVIGPFDHLIKIQFVVHVIYSLQNSENC